jgi:D-glycero-alpha-D-manno-heptose-7-phosphate kinase
LDELYQYALDNGAESAKISGAGGGGFMMIFCNPSKRIQLIRALKEKNGLVLTPSFTEIGTQAWTIYNN